MFRNRRKAVIVTKIIEKRNTGGSTEMKELAERFIYKKCIITAFDSSHVYTGVIKEVTNGAILVENGGTIEAINLEFVISIKEYPRKKNRKEKSDVVV